ncbi:hypothetical protein H9Q10_01225 [Eikenella sp. S3360]|uniref:Uncharacterized protein n=1 Tax=Eikenella glucosivorans TaxID=2766967 RepID=A0ABS0N7M4_9NEIS|nr:hypothetical protein [Eikenella glucosivorans]MBH5328295.1 hypothetical protein [Eikenella glucosivorans]
MKPFSTFHTRFWDWLGSSPAAGRLLMLACAALCGLLAVAGLVWDRLSGRSAAAWHGIIGFGLGIGTLFALYFIEEDLSDPPPERTFRRRDKYLCGAIGGFCSALLASFNWHAALAGALLGLLLAALMRWLKHVMRHV